MQQNLTPNPECANGCGRPAHLAGRLMAATSTRPAGRTCLDCADDLHRAEEWAGIR
jgi:hypothetical protein